MDKFKSTQGESSRTTRTAGSKLDNEYLWTKLMLLMYKLLGLAPWTIVRSASGVNKTSRNDVPMTSTMAQFAYSGFGCAYHVFLVLGTCGINYMTLSTVFNDDYPLKTALTVMIEVIQGVCGNVILGASRLLLCARQDTVVRTYNRFTRIECTIVGLSNDRNPESNRLFFVVLFATNVVVWIAVSVSENTCYGLDSLWSMFNAIIPAILINFFMMQYVIMVKLVETQFRAFNRALLDISRFSIIQPIQMSILSGISMNALHSPKIVTFRRTHTALYEITCELSEFYSLPMLVTIAFSCYTIIYNAYYLMMPFVIAPTETDAICMIVNALVWLIGLMLPIVMLAVGVNRTTYEMRKTADAVHKLLARSSTSREDKTELQQFSLELLQRNVQFTAYGLFPVDCTLVHSIFSMVVTYLIILFQFRMADEKQNSEVVTERNTTAR